MIEKVSPIIRALGYRLIPYNNRYRLQKDSLFIDVSLSDREGCPYEAEIALPYLIEMDETRLSSIMWESFIENLYIKTYNEEGLVSSDCSRSYFKLTILLNEKRFKQGILSLEWAYQQLKDTIDSIDL